MTVRIGVIGTGMIGEDHIRRLTHVLAGTQVVAMTDIDSARAAEVAAGLPEPARVHATGQDVIDDPAVDAVVVTSWGGSHEEYVVASIAAGKPVFCEKPLADTVEACGRILDAEVAAGRRLVQVGFMRRYDPAYRAMKSVIDSREIGAPLIMHCGHRNPAVPPQYTKDMAIADTAVHEVDIVRWLFGEEIVAAQVLVPRKSKNGRDLQDPLILVLETESGAIIDDEISVNIRYGYDIRGEIVGEDGTVALADSNPVVVRRDGAFSGAVPVDWRERFVRAYDIELQEWVASVAAGERPSGPSSWDGYAAQAVSHAGLTALHDGVRTVVHLRPKPDLYS
jgi:myo-inositol 2-dehydrogenase/D-chiro-inositol 1-dehydrogenase